MSICVCAIGALLQKLDRDTQKFAFKCSYALVEGHPVRRESVYMGLGGRGGGGGGGGGEGVAVGGKGWGGEGVAVGGGEGWRWGGRGGGGGGRGEYLHLETLFSQLS